MSIRAILASSLIKRRVARRNPPLIAIRKGLEKIARRYPPPPRSLSLDTIHIGDTEALWVTHRKKECQRVLLFLHGGGYCFGSPRTHRRVITALAHYAQAAVLAPDYRLAPEHPHPAALEDARAAWDWLLTNHPEKARFLGGDSAGGGLSLALLMRLRDEEVPLPQAAFCWSPWTDLAMTGESIETNVGSEVYVMPDVLHTMATHYLGDQDPTTPAISPFYGDLSKLPPLFIQVSDSEVLLDDSRRVADKIEVSRGEVTLQVWRNMPHVWQVLIGFVPESKAAIKATAKFLCNHQPEKS